MLRQILETRKQDLIEEIEAANRQLSSALGGVERIRISRQIVDIEKELEKIEKRLNGWPQSSAEVMSGELAASVRDLYGVLPQHEKTIKSLLRTVHALGQLHELLNEWKELHNLLQDCLLSLSPIETELIYLKLTPDKWDKNRGVLLWKACTPKFYALKQFACGLKFIDVRLTWTENGVQSGPPWMIEILKQLRDVGSCLGEGDHNAVFEVISELSHKCLTALYQADKSIRDVAAEIHQTTREIARSLEDE